MNIFLFVWLIISVIVIIIWLLLILLKKFSIRSHREPTEMRRVTGGAPDYSSRDYFMHPSAAEYYGIYSPPDAAEKAEDEVDDEEKKRRAALPHCPQCGGAIGYLDNRCPKCGLRLSSKNEFL